MNLLSIGMYSMAFQVLWFLGAIVVAVVLMQMYTRTRMSGFLWLLMAVVVWPTIARMFSVASTMLLPQYLSRTEGTTVSAALLMTCVAGLEGLLGVALLIMAVLKLNRQFGRVMAGSLPPVPGTPMARYPQA